MKKKLKNAVNEGND